MSSWKPPEEEERDSSYDPGVQEGEVAEERDFSETLADLDSIDYLMLGILISIPAAILSILLLLEFYPGFQDAAGDIVGGLLDSL
jgi:uncharacterized membrane protein